MEQVEVIFLSFLGIWNLTISVILWQTLSHYRRLAGKVAKGNLERVLETLLKEEKLTFEAVNKIKVELKKLETAGKSYFLNAGLVRFNPFSDSGGDQSFSLAILDSYERGVVITGLHGRQTTRFYTKLLDGKTEVKLSTEEKLAIKKAMGRKG